MQIRPEDPAEDGGGREGEGRQLEGTRSPLSRRLSWNEVWNNDGRKGRKGRGGEGKEEKGKKRGGTSGGKTAESQI